MLKCIYNSSTSHLCTCQCLQTLIGNQRALEKYGASMKHCAAPSMRVRICLRALPPRHCKWFVQL